MKHKFIIILFILSTAYSYSQNPNWFQDVSSITQIDKALGARVWIADVNGDNYPDLLTNEGKSIRNRLQLFINQKDPNSKSNSDRIFVDISEESGINQSFYDSDIERYSDVAALADVDNDGDIDLVTSTYFHRITYFYVADTDSIEYGHYTEVLLNDGKGNFTLMENHGLREIEIFTGEIDGRNYPSQFLNSTAISFLDYDYDGILDMYFGTWFIDYRGTSNDRKMPDLLFKGNGDGSFSRINDKSINSVVEPLYGVNVTDWNNDGWQDIITSPYCRSGGSLFKNNQDGTFSDATAQANYSAQHLGGDHGQPICQWEAMTGDFDNDGDMDLLQVSVHGGYNENEGRTTIAINQGADNNYRYEWDLSRLKRDAPLGTHVGDMGGSWIDIDNNGYLDVLIGQQGYEDVNVMGQARLYVLYQDDNGYFNDITADLGLKETMIRVHSIEPIDYDLDGDLDLLFSRQVTIDGTSVMQMTLLRNNFANEKNWLQVKLNMPENTNKSGIGARIYVYSGGMLQMREIQAGAGHFGGQTSFILHTGIEFNNRIDSLIIRYPNSEIETLTINNPALNTILEINPDGNYSPLILNDEQLPIIAFDKGILVADTLHPDGESQVLTFNVENIGNTPLYITSMSLNDNFDGSLEIINDIDDLTLQPNEKYELEVKFDPIKRQVCNTTIDFASNAANGSLRKVDLHAVGYEPSPLISTVELIDFGTLFRGTTKDTILIIKNSGEMPLNVTNIAVTENQPFFEIPNDIELPLTLSPDEEYNLPVKCHNVYGEVVLYGNIWVESDAFDYPERNIKLSVIGAIPYPKAVFSQTTLSFGGVRINESNTAEFTISNTGDTTLVISIADCENCNEQISIYPADNESEELPFAINQYEERTFVIEYSPNKKGSLGAKLILNTNDPENELKTLTLNGIGLEATSVSYDLRMNSEVSISPNPAKDAIELNIRQGILPDGNYTVKLVNSLGMVTILETDISNYNEIHRSYDISKYPSGLYILFLTNNQYSFTIPFIKSK